MQEHDLMISILENPADDLPRLVYADWLEEHGQGERASFIRAQIAFAQLPSVCQKSGKELADGGESIDPNNFVPHCRCEVCRPRRQAYMSGRRHIGLEWCPTQIVHQKKFAEWQKHYGIEERGGNKEKLDEAVRNMPRMIHLSPRWRRGFPSEVRLSLAEFVGGECSHCNGNGSIMVRGQFAAQSEACQSCHGTGRTTGLAATLGQWPLEKITLGDREPSRTFIEVAGTPVWCWWKDGYGQSVSNIGDELWELLLDSREPMRAPREMITVDDYPTRDAALSAISTACLRFAREEWRKSKTAR